ncbi:hypothetical protein UFOVP830_17 [uncultured Caudovirales phage]|uniref:DNA transfer protein n=1 Tax=uncultured Caudovirales phage TaxID=2100421 RepID=A0A6J5NYZ6_9CAUD|nr:hypothetical protein UFOVP830_17 [uncultured Caudovirales phage]
MTWAVTAAAGGQIIGGLMGASSARKQARAKAAALEAAKGQITGAYNTSKGYYDPYYQTGTAASNRLAELMGVGGNAGAEGYGSLMRNFSMADYQQDPGYQFRLQEGLKQLQGQAAARGGLLSGATQRGTQKYAQNVASQEYGNAYDRYMQQQQNRYNMLAGQQGVGMRAGGALADLSTGYGANMANLATGQGAVEAAKIAGQNAGYTQALGGVTNFLGGNPFNFGTGTTPTTPTNTSTYGGYNSFDLSNPFSTNWGK